MVGAGPAEVKRQPRSEFDVVEVAGAVQNAFDYHGFAAFSIEDEVVSMDSDADACAEILAQSVDLRLFRQLPAV